MLTALLIMLREGFEAALVVAIVYAYIRRIGRPDLVGPMWQGMAAAVALSVGAGIAVHLTVENLTGEPRLLAFAAVSLLAAAVLTWMIFWMRRQARHLKGELDVATAAMAKYFTTDLQCELIDQCLQFFGGYGYMWEYPIARLYADARVQKIYGGTNEIMKELIGRTL